MELFSSLKVTSSTWLVGPGSTFVAIPGFKADGATFIPEAIKRGAIGIVAHVDSTLAQNYSKEFSKIPFRFVDNPRRELAICSARAYGHPSKKLKLIGVTGTKGKTTTTFLIHHILKSVGKKAALLSSIKNIIGSTEQESLRTTMESDKLHAFFDMCVKQGVTHVVMEVSSHAIALYRTYGLEFDVACFTNLAPEHLDFHETIENYFETKKQLFGQLKPNARVFINTKDVWGEKLYEQLDKQRDMRVESLSPRTITAPFLRGSFNGLNVRMACDVASSLGISDVFITNALQHFLGVPGRMQLHVLQNSACAYVDYAHEQLSFETILRELRTMTDHLIIVFGCGEGRRQKRKPLGKIAAYYGDVIILTEDNPGFDDPREIVGDIMSGVSEEKKDIVVEHDRKEAIRRAVSLSRSTSIIAILGKGHEKYQLIKDQRVYFCDFEEVAKY